MTQWQVIDAGQLIPGDLVSAIQGAAGLANGVLQAIQTSLEGMVTLPSVADIPDAPAIAASALVSSLDALVSGTKAHVIVIPVSKAIPGPPATRAPATVDDLQTWLDIRLGPPVGTAEAYQALVAGSGGNAGFYRAFLESLFDAGDPNRPQFVRQSDAVTMIVIMSGASSYAAVAHAASIFDQLVKPPGPIGGAGGRVIPVPQNVVTKPVSAASGGRIAVQISWDPPPAVITLPYFPGLSLSIRRYAVIRMTKASAPATRGVLDLFQTQSLTEGMASRDAVVVAIGSGLNSRFLDPSPPSDPASPLYYCVAWEVEIAEPSGSTVMPFDQVSGVAKVAATAPPPTHAGAPPDWITVGRALGAFPELENAARRLLAQVGSIVGGSPSPVSRLSSALGVAATMADRLSARADDLMTDVTRLQASLSRPAPSIHAIQVTSGTGGNAFLAAELARRLEDVSDPSRPPFDSGEYVCGVCIVAGAPRLADLATIVGLFGSLVGPAEPSNPLLSVLAAIDTAVTQAEASVFGPGFDSIKPSPGVVIDPLTGRPALPATPVVSAAGIPVPTDDPSNPNQGDTNVTPLSKLC